MNIINRAIQIAAYSHEGQMDKCSQPYILHPLRVMLAMQSEHDRATAVLHDVIEDTFVTKEYLLGELIPQVVVDAVDAMSKRNGERYDEYLERVKWNEIATRVKIADIKDNACPARLYQLDPKTITRLSTKYAKALRYLES